MKFPACTLILACLLCLPSAPAQDGPPGSGHWQGSILVHNQEILIEVDLWKNPRGEWIGSIDIPGQSTKGLPLSDVAVKEITYKETSVKFAMKGPPGDPKFDGKLFAEGKAMSGVYTQGEASLTFSLKRTGDAVPPPKSTAISKEMEGLWEGALDVKGTTLRIKLNLSNQPDGTSTGTLISAEMGEIPITTITQKGFKLKLEIRTIQVSYDGDLTKGALVGYWMQGREGLPLTFTRPQEDKK